MKIVVMEFLDDRKYENPAPLGCLYRTPVRRILI